MAIMDKWEEDHDFYFLLLRTLRVLLEGSDGIRNYWFFVTDHCPSCRSLNFLLFQNSCEGGLVT